MTAFQKPFPQTTLLNRNDQRVERELMTYNDLCYAKRYAMLCYAMLELNFTNNFAQQYLNGKSFSRLSTSSKELQFDIKQGKVSTTLKNAVNALNDLLKA